MNRRSKISLGIDARVLFRKNIRGIGRYLKNLIQLAPDDFDITLYGEKEFEKYFNISLPDNIKIKTFNLKGYRIQAWEQIGLPFFILYKQHDLFFSPANTVPLIHNCKTILTLHDAHLWLSSDNYGMLNWYYKYLLPLALRRVSKVITISHFSRQELLSIFPFLKRKIEVIYHGIDPIFRPDHPFDENLIPKALSVKKPYLLYIGGDSPKKQPYFAIKLFCRLSKYYRNYSLLMLGINEEKKDLFYEMFKNEKIRSNLIILPPISDELLAMLYSNADVVLYPTLHEGFGFPVLEAMLSKVPILASNVASIPEISGGFAFLLPPKDLNAWEKQLIEVIENRERYSTQIEKAYNWARSFSWQRCVDKTYNLFREIAR